LEIAANPYIALCGPLEYAEVRLNLSQAFQAIGTICSPLLATKVLFSDVLDASSLVDVQWAYLGIAIFVFFLAVVFYYIPLPEATDEQLQDFADCRRSSYNARIGPYKVIYLTLGLGVFSQWVYVGLQESVGSNFGSLMRSIRPRSTLSTFDFLTVAHTVFAAGRFLTAFLNYLLKPRYVLLLLYTGLVICLGLTMHMTGTGAVIVSQLTFFFEAGIFSIIFAIAMRGLGVHTKSGSAFMTAAISGGAAFPPIQWGVSNNRGTLYSYCVPLAAAVAGMLFPLYLNLVPAAQRQVDPVHERRTGRRGTTAGPQNSVMPEPDPSVQKSGLTGILARRKRNMHIDQPKSSVVQLKADHRGTPILTVDFAQAKEAENSSPAQPTQHEHEIPDLAPWPHDDTAESSPASSSGGSKTDPGHEDLVTKIRKTVITYDSSMSVPRERPEWEKEADEFDDIDDYHAMMRNV
jgi:hypothetical protein